MVTALLSSAVGLLLLYFGAEALVKGGSSLGLRLGLSPLVVGLTIVAFGTSAPELAVSVNAAYIGKTDVSVGNVIGSNIANIGLILGLSALVRPVHIDIKLVRIDVPIMIAVSALLCVLLLDTTLTVLDGVLLVAGLVAFTVFSVVSARRARSLANVEFEAGLGAGQKGLLREVLLIVAGLAMLTIGARYMVDGAVQLARIAGVSEAVIGLTIVAIGTSLPELATSVLAAARRMSDISVGNIVGSNIFNILGVLGASSMLAPLPLGNVTWLDVTIMMLFTVAVLPLAAARFLLRRWEGAIFVISYVAYLASLLVLSR